MRAHSALLFGLSLLAAAPQRYASVAPPVARPNDNRSPAGSTTADGLTLSLEARRVMWHPDGDSLRGRSTEAFGETGKSAMVPAPLVRVRAGTPVRITVRNVDIPDTLRFMLSPLLGGDTIVVPPGGSTELRYTPTKPGNYYYRAFGSDVQSQQFLMKGLLAGAFIVDSANAGPPRDRVLVLNWLVDSLDKAGAPNFNRMVFSINGLSWPHTERFTATVGDSIRWRVINLNNDVHPLHLHGVYYRVDEYSGTPLQMSNVGPPGSMVVTQRMATFATMSLTWSPEREGNWLFHCHFAFHILPTRIIEAADSVLLKPPPMEHGGNHALSHMAGLVVGIHVKPRPRVAVVPQSDAPRRRLRLVAFADSALPDTAPSFRFRLEEAPTGARTEARPGFSPPLNLTRGEPVSITVVNNLHEATSVHWHGMELESYYDGVAHFGGVGKKLSPMIMPRDSFEARFTPPRSGTFMYHSHVNEVRQQSAGLVGPMIVRDPGMPLENEHTFFIKAARANPGGNGPLEIGGQTNPDTVVVRVGVPTRFRFIGLTAFHPSATVWVTARSDSAFRNFADSLVVQWKPIAKDGYDLPEAQRVMKRARQVISMGETFDYEYTPVASGRMLIEVRTSAATGNLLARIPLRVE